MSDQPSRYYGVGREDIEAVVRCPTCGGTKEDVDSFGITRGREVEVVLSCTDTFHDTTGER